MKKTRWFITILFLLSFILGGLQTPEVLAAPPPPEEEEVVSSSEAKTFDAGLIQALEGRLQQLAMAKTEILAFVLYETYIDHVIYSEDGVTALLWLGLREPDTGEVIETEPGLAIARVDSLQKSLDGTDSWDLTLQADMDWEDQFNSLPADLMTEDLQLRYAQAPESDAKSTTVFRGYKLPWAGGIANRITGSIGHFLIYKSCGEASCRYAYDFSSRTSTTPATMFPLLASKGGTVYKWKDSQPNGNETTPGNYIVLKDESTNPVTYQLYLHLAYNSIPPNLKYLGAPVLQGQFIGNADDTGASTGHHLHFHVHTNPLSYWGNSIDIRFEDVDTNDGTPRTCDEVDRFPNYGTQCHRAIPGVRELNQYVSGNFGAFPPTGDLIMPGHGEIINGASLLVGGWAQDDLGIAKVQIIARPRGGEWKVVGPAMSGTTYMTEISLCDANLPNGPIDLAVRIIDLEGNQISTVANLRTIINNAPCSQLPPPACNPNDNQVAMFTQKDYQGVCRIYNVGDYGTADSLGTGMNDTVKSILVGNNVRALLYDRGSDRWTSTINPTRTEAFEANDPNLFDNRINLNMVSSMQVQLRSVKPFTPTIATIFNDYSRNNDSNALSSSESYVIDFASRGATEFRAELTGPKNMSLPWTKQVGWSVGSLPAGGYTITVWGRNSAGESSTSKNFNVVAGSLPSVATVTAPVSFDFESGEQNWTGINMWHHTASPKGFNSSKVWLFNDSYPGSPSVSNNLGDPNIGGGDLTSPPISIPANGNTYYLHFDYFYQTENFFTYYDHRWVQISENGGPFNNILQLSLDAEEAWLTSKAINLSAYAGKTIRVRFHMDIVDAFFNEGFGWMIDNVRIDTNAPITCLNNVEPNDTFSQATIFPANGEVFSKICPGGDLDYYRFTGYAGEEVELDIDAMDFGSELDPYLLFFDHKGNLLAENDDVVYTVERDSYIKYTLPHSGEYYVLVKAWDHPRAGGDNFHYTLKMKRSGDFTPPQVTFTSPASDKIPQTAFKLKVDATDFGIGNQTGVKRVDFYWRGGNIASSSWVLLGSDTNGSDGWSVMFDPTKYTNVLNGLLYAQAFDGAGNQHGDLRIVKGYDQTIPVTTLAPISSPRATTYIPLKWTTNVPSGSVDYYDLQYKIDGGTWQDVLPRIPGTKTFYDFIGEMGKSYEFRIRSVANTGYVEPYPDGTKSTILINTCSPDNNENNNLFSSATALPINTNQEHNFCATADVDWVKLGPVQAGNPYMVFVTSRGGGASMNVEVYKNNASTLVQTYTATFFGQSQIVTFDAVGNDTYYLKITPIVSGLAGNEVKYTVWYDQGTPTIIYMPVINR
ncbi:MAG TPA: peptidoglycan DD-metalloendopeptidase family protein [Anaerolineaceae bacterium]|nr:peptidoglycan DD-metalloendopeptidase family protein [Anaerolineaceae bacterium]